MTLEETIEKLGAIPLRRYCQITGESVNSIHQRIHKGTWKAGVHVVKPEGSDHWWVILTAVREWVQVPPVELVASYVQSELAAS